MSKDSADTTVSGAGSSAVDQLIQRCPDATLCADQRGHIIFWNPAAEALFGISSEQAIGQSLDIIVPQPMRGAHEAGMKRILAGGSPRIVGNIVEVIAQHAVTGHHFPIEMSLSMWSHGDERRFGAVVRDVSARRRNEDRLHQLAHFDQLTLLPNRTLLLNRLETALAEPDKVGLALLMIDLDGFKEINDCYGHATGDAALKAFAIRLHREMTDRIALSHPVGKDAVTLSRFGGDEFAVLLTGVHDADYVCALADDVRKAVADPVLIDGRPLTLTASIGVALAPHHGTTSAELLANADLALYRAKSAGRSRTTVFEPLMRLAVVKQRADEADLRRGWKANEFEVFFQPQVDLADRSIIGAEALLRWRHPDKGLLAPGAFLAVLERMDLSKRVGDWVLAEACRMTARWRQVLPELRVGVNLFSSQIQDPALHQTVLSALKASKLPAEALELEITETSVLYEDSVWVKRLKRLRAAGVGLAFDDYGTGYASLSLLKRYPVSRLKIDRSFVIERGNESGNVSIIKAIVSFGHTFGVDVIAEGIETVRQHEFLISLGCRQGQGYLYGRPMPAGAFTDLLSNRIACAG